MITHRDVMNSLPKKRRWAIEARSANPCDGRARERDCHGCQAIQTTVMVKTFKRRCPSRTTASRRVKERGPWGSCPRRQNPLLRLSLNEHIQLVAVLSHGPHGGPIHTSEACEVPEKFLLRKVLRFCHSLRA
jgi:hypothetical protein